MLRKLAVALIAASAFTAPVLAQTTAPANPPAKTDTAPTVPAPAAATTTPATTAPPNVVAAKPSLKSAKIKHHRRLAHRVKRTHAKHVKLVKHTKHVKHVQRAKSAKHLKTAKIAKTSHGAKHVHHIIRKSTTARSDAPSAPKSVN